MTSALNFNQRMQTITLMGAQVWQWGNGSNRTYDIAMHGASQYANALYYSHVGQWVRGVNMRRPSAIPMVVGPASIEAIMALDMDDLQWLLER